MFSNVSEYICYSGSLVSAVIAVRLLKMGNLNTMTFYNKMFILYFGIDSVTGFLEEYFLFRLREDRSWMCKVFFVNKWLTFRPRTEQLTNCTIFLTLWMASIGSRGIIHIGLIFCRDNYTKKISAHFLKNRITFIFPDLSMFVTPQVCWRRASLCYTGQLLSSSLSSAFTSCWFILWGAYLYLSVYLSDSSRLRSILASPELKTPSFLLSLCPITIPKLL